MNFLTKKLTLILLVLILIIAAVPSLYFYNQYQKSQQLLKNPSQAAKEEAQKIIDAVSKLIVLPNETPTIATITDKNKLKDQPFFAQAQNGDKVLIYTNAKKAIIYRPSTNKIIDIAPVNIGTNTAIAKVVLYNGTKTVGLTAQIETKIKDIANIQITDKSNAAKNDYEKTLVVDLSGTHTQEAKAIAGALNGAIGTLPSGETKPSGADIMVIIGTTH